MDWHVRRAAFTILTQARSTLLLALLMDQAKYRFSDALERTVDGRLRRIEISRSQTGVLNMHAISPAGNKFSLGLALSGACCLRHPL
jgi:hypothetical protein